MFKPIFYIIIFIILLIQDGLASDSVIRFLDSKSEDYAAMSKTIWSLAELGYQEKETSKLMQSHLKQENFSIDYGVAEIPTAFIASYGSGKPIIAILAEMDALPGLSQDAKPERKIIKEGMPGHACGHHLFGAGSAWSAVTVKEWLSKNNKKGTIRFYGTPAEEGGSGKVYMVRDGLFDDVDVVLHWHPGSVNHTSPRTSNANKSAKFTFKGLSAHAASAPHRGRSALDGVESMNFMVNMMREHIPQESRIHYVITKGGLAPNVIPDEAEVWYYERHPKETVVEELFQRTVKAANGAAEGTETTLSYEVIHGNYSLMPNDTLQTLMYKQLVKRGGIVYNKQEREFAEEIYKTLLNPSGSIGDQEKILPYQTFHGYGSTDVGDVSWLVPTAGARIASWVPGTPGHSWQAVASGGTTIGLKGEKLAAQVLSDTAIEIYLDPSIVEEAEKELSRRVGKDFNYFPLLGDRDPPLDYRN